MELPNKNNLWTWGVSLALYTKPYKETNGTIEKTVQGEAINKYKYHEDLGVAERKLIAKDFTQQIFKVIKQEFESKFPNPVNPPFNVCLGLPENRNTGRSLPRDICHLLSVQHSWLTDGFHGIRKTRPGNTIKGIPHDKRFGIVKDLYAIDSELLPKSKIGFLIIDDVFETGSTVSSLCNTLNNVYPNIPRFVIALTHLHATERFSK
jgi:predicted amidophosphoribosyltransferase